MPIPEIIAALRNISSTLCGVKVEGEENLDRILATIRYSRNIANQLEQQLKAEADEEPSKE